MGKGCDIYTVLQENLNQPNAESMENTLHGGKKSETHTQLELT
jgi:hypothetical protein